MSIYLMRLALKILLLNIIHSDNAVIKSKILYPAQFRVVLM
jgi:hypothetical protein